MTEPRESPPRALFPIGLRYMALSAFSFSIMSLLVKLAGERFSTMELVFARAFVVSVLALGDLWRRRVPLRNPEQGLLLLRGLIGLAALASLYFSLIRLPLAEATVLQFTNPLWTALIAALLLGEALHRRELALTAVSLAGVILVVRPFGLLGGSQVELDPLGVAGALAGALLAAGAYVLVRRLRRHDAMLVVFTFALVSVVIGFPLMLPSFVWPQGYQWVLLLGIGLATFGGQITMTMGLQRERAGRATAVGYLQIVFASIWGMIFFAAVPAVTTLLGAGLIVGATLFLAPSRQTDA
jgi:drug/metabolite transporter (DMT)-like permease